MTQLRCKVGDMAIKIKAGPQDTVPAGAILECVLYDPDPHMNQHGEIWRGGIWLVKYQGRLHDLEGYPWACRDEFLMPIRPQEGEDETLQWLPVPTTETV